MDASNRKCICALNRKCNLKVYYQEVELDSKRINREKLKKKKK